MKKRAVAILLVCTLGLVAYLVWPTTRDAEYYFNRALERRPGHDNAPGDPKGAIADFSRAIKLNSNYAAAYAGRASAKTIMAETGYSVPKKVYLGEAMADLDRAIEVDPTKDIYFMQRAHLKREKGDFSGAVADAARESEVVPPDQIPLRHIGSSPDETTARLLRGGLHLYDRAITNNPAFSWGYYHRGVFKHLANDFDGALADFRRCSEFADSQLKDDAAIHIWLVRAQRKETADANAELSAHFSARTNDSSPNWEMQIAGFLLDRVSEADLVAAANSPDAERRRSQFWYYKGTKQLLAGDKVEAAECFREALTTQRRPYAVLMSAEIQLGLLNLTPQQQ
jgi:tetratricopeptide (TPR) repeat protein